MADEYIAMPASKLSGLAAPGRKTQKDTIEIFKIALMDKDGRTRAIACHYFNRMAQKDPKSIPDEVIPLLIKNLNNRTWQTEWLTEGTGRYFAADTLFRIGKRAADCLKDELIKLDDPSSGKKLLEKNDLKTVKLAKRIIELIDKKDTSKDKAIKENINIKN
jgi:hypothetical protein